jgi:hypothetical protein
MGKDGVVGDFITIEKPSLANLEIENDYKAISLILIKKNSFPKTVAKMSRKPLPYHRR